MTTTIDTAAALDSSWAAKIERLRGRKPAEEFVTLYDDELRREADTARLRVMEARRTARQELVKAGHSGADLDALLEDHDAVKAAREAHTAADAAAAEGDIVWHFRALPPDVYENLQIKHQPTDEQSAQGMTYNPVTLLPALISACSVNPITPEQVGALIRPGEDEAGEPLPAVLNQGEVATLFAACRSVNEQPRMSLGKGSRPTAG